MRSLALIAFLIAAVIVDLGIVAALDAALPLSEEWLSFLRCLGGVLIGMYGLKLFRRFWPKSNEGWSA